MGSKDQNYNLLFVVCHPDDEALWVGGLVESLSTFQFLKVYVLCLSGVDAQSTRESEFYAARQVAGYTAGVVMGDRLRPATEPLTNIAYTVEHGIKKLNLEIGDISLLITHSPYGDEHALLI